MSLTILTNKQYEDLINIGNGKASRFDISEVFVGKFFQCYTDGWIYRRSMACKVTSIYLNDYGGYDFTFDVNRYWWGDVYSCEIGCPWIYIWFGIF